MGVIYLRTNTINGMQYVGQTKDFKRREWSWKCLKWNYANQLLTEDRNKYGLEKFKTEILEECDNSKLDELERYYIEKLNTIYPNGYNDNEGGSISFHHSDRTKKKISESNKGKEAYNKGKTLNELYGEETAAEIRKKISDKAKERVGEKNPFYGKHFEIHPMQGKHHSNKTKEKLRKSNLNNPKLCMRLVQIKDSGEKIEWEGQREASRNGYDCGNISKAVNGQASKKNPHHYKDSEWYKKEDYEKMLGN